MAYLFTYSFILDFSFFKNTLNILFLLKIKYEKVYQMSVKPLQILLWKKILFN